MGIGGFFKGLGKGLLKVAPIAAAFIPGVGPLASMAIGAGTGALSGGINGGKKGALIGGLMGGATGAAGSALKGAGGVMHMGINGIPGVGVSSGLPTDFISKLGGGLGSGIPNIGVSSGLPADFISKLTGGTAGGGSGIMDLLKKSGSSALKGLLSPQGMEGLGRGVGAIGQTQASNRGTELDAMMEADRQKLLAERDRRDEQTDLWKKLQAADYMKSGGTPASGPSMSANGKPFTSFGFGPKPISDANKAMASTMETQLLDRLQHPTELRDYDSKMKPGGLEKATDYLGPILTAMGIGRQAAKPTTVNPSTANPYPPKV